MQALPGQRSGLINTFGLHPAIGDRCSRLNHVSCTCVSFSVNELYVDDPDKDSGGKIDVSLNISLPNLHCEREYPPGSSPPNSLLQQDVFSGQLGV